MSESRTRQPASRVSVLLVDDHTILLDALTRRLEGDGAFRVVGAVGCLSEAYACVRRAQPDVVLLDIDMGSESGLDAIGQMRKDHPGIRIVMLSMHEQPILRSHSFELGADAFVTKGARFETLRAVILGGVVPREEGRAACAWLHPGSAMPELMTLSRRELQVARAVASGLREKEIAGKLGIGISSVNTYLRRAMEKMGVASRVELSRQAMTLYGSAGDSPLE